VVAESETVDDRVSDEGESADEDQDEDKVKKWSELMKQCK